jgi:peptidoglycan/xylan/chitin deacetylase (PgdA/CDA1 family)
MGRENVIWNEAAESEQSNIMTWNQAKIMKESGLVDFQSHGMSHKYLNKLNDEDLNFELIKPFDLFKKNLGYYPVAIAYPYGGFSEELALKTQQAGYQFACTTQEGINTINNLNNYKLVRIAVRGYKWIYYWKFKQQAKKGFIS